MDDMKRPPQGAMRRISSNEFHHMHYMELEISALSTTSWRPSRSEAVEMAVLMLLSLVAALDATIMIPALPYLAQHLTGSANTVFWSGTGYLLTAAVFQPIYGSLSRCLSRGAILLSTLVFFATGTAICAAARDFETVVVGRTIQGVGGGGIFASCLIAFTAIVPAQSRPKYWALIQSAWAVGMIMGPVIGGALAEPIQWRWIFYLNFPPIFVALLPGLWNFLHRRFAYSNGVPSPPLRQIIMPPSSLAKLDWVGMLVFVSASSGFLFGITSGGVLYAWASWQVILAIISGGVGVIMALVWEAYGFSQPFIPMRFFRSLSSVAIFACGLLQGLLLLTQGYYIPIYLESVKSYSAFDAGKYMLAVTASMLPISAIVGIYMARAKQYSLLLRVGWVVTTLASGLLVTLGEDPEKKVWLTILVLVGLGHGLTLGPGLFAAQEIVGSSENASSDLEAVTSLYSFARNCGMCVGVASGGAIFTNVMSSTLGRHSLPTEIAANAPAFVMELSRMPTGGTVRQMIVSAYKDGMEAIMVFLTAISGLGLLLSLFV